MCATCSRSTSRRRTGRCIVRFVNPDDEAKEEAARADGVQPVAHQKIDGDHVTIVEGYRGMVLRYLDQTRSIPVIQDTTGLEYIVTSAIKELVGERKPIGIVGGHGGPSLEQGLTSLRSVLSLYDAREVDASQDIDPAARSAADRRSTGAFQRAGAQAHRSVRHAGRLAGCLRRSDRRRSRPARRAQRSIAEHRPRRLARRLGRSLDLEGRGRRAVQSRPDGRADGPAGPGALPAHSGAATPRGTARASCHVPPGLTRCFRSFRLSR